MAAKVYSVVMKVESGCQSCYKKMSKAICSIQEHEKIDTILYDEKNKTITLSGSFDPGHVCRKLCSKARKVIKDIQVKEGPQPKKEEPKKEEPKKANPEPKPVLVCSCGCRSWCEGYYGNYRCPWCGRAFDQGTVAPPPVVVQLPLLTCGAPPSYGYKCYEHVYVENMQPSCIIM